MSRRSEERARAAILARRREDFREAMTDVRGAIERASGARVGAAWVLPVAAGALGIAIAWSLRRLRSR